jgi:lipase chaperone LimK
MKTVEINSAYQVLYNAKLSKMENSDKFKVIRAIRAMKPIVTDFEDFQKDAQGHEEIVEKAQQWQREGEKTTLTIEERTEINKYLNYYNQRIMECVKDEAEKEHELQVESLSEEAFGKLLESNDWNANKIMTIQDFLC